MSETLANLLDKSLIDKVYPVGSIYMSVNAADPAALFGGTWEQIKDRFLLAAGDAYAAGSTGGEETHTLTVDEMPVHSHSNPIHVSWDYEPNTESPWSNPWNQSGNLVYDNSSRTSNEGGGLAHNNMPPYLSVYMWKRTA